MDGRRIWTFEVSSKNSSVVNAILISYCCVFNQSSKSAMKGYRVESMEEKSHEYKTIVGREAGEKLIDSKNFF